MDGDGDLDVVFGNHNKPNKVYLNKQAPVVLGTTPATHTVTTPLDSNLSITFSQQINASTVSTQTIVAHGSMSGRLNGTFSMSGDVVTFNPSRNLWPGEQVRTMVLNTVQNLTGTAAFASQWQVTGKAGVGPAVFLPQLARQITSDSDPARRLAVGDVDGDGDLDVAVIKDSPPHQLKIYRNNGDGTFAAGCGWGWRPGCRGYKR